MASTGCGAGGGRDGGPVAQPCPAVARLLGTRASPAMSPSPRPAGAGGAVTDLPVTATRCPCRMAWKRRSAPVLQDERPGSPSRCPSGSSSRRALPTPVDFAVRKTSTRSLSCCTDGNRSFSETGVQGRGRGGVLVQLGSWSGLPRAARSPSAAPGGSRCQGRGQEEPCALSRGVPTAWPPRRGFQRHRSPHSETGRASEGGGNSAAARRTDGWTENSRWREAQDSHPKRA